MNADESSRTGQKYTLYLTGCKIESDWVLFSGAIVHKGERADGECETERDRQTEREGTRHGVMPFGHSEVTPHITKT